MSTSVEKNTRVMDIVRHVEPQASQYNQVVAGSRFANDRRLQLLGRSSQRDRFSCRFSAPILGHLKYVARQLVACRFFQKDC